MEKIEEKTCKLCKTVKPLERFSPKQGTCKDCRNAKKREQYKEKGIHKVNYYSYGTGYTNKTPTLHE